MFAKNLEIESYLRRQLEMAHSCLAIRILWGLLASTHFMLISCTTWLGTGESFENLEQTFPEKDKELKAMFWTAVLLVQIYHNNYCKCGSRSHGICL